MMWRGKVRRLWNGKPMPYYQITRFEDFDPDTIQPKTAEEIASAWFAFMDEIEEIYGHEY